MSGRTIGRLSTAALALAVAANACEPAPGPGTGPLQKFGHPERAAALVERYGCGSCHVIPGLDSTGTVGPPLIAWAQRTYIAGMLPNTPAYLVRWIMTPQAVVPGNDMPNMGVSRTEAADIAAYLYTIR